MSAEQNKVLPLNATDAERSSHLAGSRLLTLSAAGTLVVVGLVYFTGGPISPLLVLFLPLVMAPSLLGARAYGLAFAAVNTLAYSALYYLLWRGILPSWDGLAIQTPKGGVGFQILGLASGMVLVSVLSSYLAGKLKRSHQQVQESIRSISKLASEQAALMNQLPEGVITVDSSGAITSINQAAATMLGVNRPETERYQFNELMRAVPSETVAKAMLEATSGSSQELSWKEAQGGAERVLLLNVRSVLNDEGAQSGLLYTIQNLTELRSIESKLADQEKMARLLSERGATTSKSTPKFAAFVGESPVMKKVYNLISRVGPTDATVMVVGESGTGKELVAKAIHSVSGRGSGPFVAVNCGAIPAELIESELFGHKKGSFTGADSDSTGLFRHANGGTIFLDEIGELPLQMQAKLLRVIQEKSVRPVGDTRDIPIDVRIVAATNRNLKREIEGGRFREDLYYRLNVIAINLPPLRDRREDLPVLIDSILRKLVPNGRAPIIPSATLDLLLSHDYPGNVRELENILERAVVLGGEVILPEHLPESMKLEQKAQAVAGIANETKIILTEENIQFPINLDELLSKIERRYLEGALSQTKGAKKRAAELLGMNFRSFRYRLEKFGMHSD